MSHCSERTILPLVGMTKEQGQNQRRIENVCSLYTNWSIMEEDVVGSSTKLLCLVCSSYFEPQGFQSESTATSKSSKK